MSELRNNSADFLKETVIMTSARMRLDSTELMPTSRDLFLLFNVSDVSFIMALIKYKDGILPV